MRLFSLERGLAKTLILISLIAPVTAISQPTDPRDPVQLESVALKPDPTRNYAESVPLHTKKPKSKSIRAYVTGYNTFPEQTDGSPCAAAGGNICGRMDVVACPSTLPLGSKVRIDGRTYTCMDRTAAKHDGRFDISCDKDRACPYRVTGWKNVEIL